VILACGQDDLRKGRERWNPLGRGACPGDYRHHPEFFTRRDWHSRRPAVRFGSAFSRFANVLPRESRSSFHFCCFCLLLYCFLAGKHSNDFNFAISPTPASPAISAGGFFRRLSAYSRFAPGSESVLAILKMSLLFSAQLPTATGARFTQRAIGSGFGPSLGWLAVVLVIVGLILLVRKIYPLRAKARTSGIGLPASYAAILFALHGLVDVSGHRVGTIVCRHVFLLGLIAPSSALLQPSRSVSILFRLIGLILLVVGSSWVVAAQEEKLLPGSVGVTNAKQLATIDNRERNFAETIAVYYDRIEMGAARLGTVFFPGCCRGRVEADRQRAHRFPACAFS